MREKENAIEAIQQTDGVLSGHGGEERLKAAFKLS